MHTRLVDGRLYNSTFCLNKSISNTTPIFLQYIFIRSILSSFSQKKKMLRVRLVYMFKQLFLVFFLQYV